MNNLDYGIIGNCKSAALIDKQGSIDWCCLPHFDSSSIFAKLLDDDKGGFFTFETVGKYKITQSYVPKTNVLSTVFSNSQNSFEVLDFMPRYKTDAGSYHCPPDIIRYLRPTKGKPKFRIVYNPKPAYAQHNTKTIITKEFIKHATVKGAYESIYLYTDLNINSVANQKPITLEKDAFVLVSYNQKLFKPDIDWAKLELERTKVYWMGWVSKNNIKTKYDQYIQRSSLVLKLLSNQKTGAILAAVTTSLPETIGEVRNWDYRYCWIRDASMTINILTRLGHFNVAQRFFQFILDVISYKDENIKIMYGINPNRQLKEMTLNWLKGYESSKPVRIGNAAAKQKQNDIFGTLLDAIFECLMIYRESLNNKEDIWTLVRTLVRNVADNWKKTDSSIWEFRSDQKHFTFSKILCWVAMDRASRIAYMFGKRQDAQSYSALGDTIRKDILKKGCCPKTGALTQYYGGSAMDASNLLAQQYGFLSPKDPVYVQTVLQTYEQLCKDGLMYRYKNADDFGLPKSSFTVCTFWMIKSLFLIGKNKLAVEMFEKLLGYSNHLGLFSEDLDFATKRLLGNFPQGYSHLSLIDTAITLSESQLQTK